VRSVDQRVRRLLQYSLCFLIASGLALSVSAHAADKPVLAVMKFQDESGAMPMQGGIGRVVTNMLSTELAARDAFTIVERRKLLQIMEEQDLAQSGRLKPGEGAKIGQLTGAQFLVMGTITAFEPEVDSATVNASNTRRGRVGAIARRAYLAIDLRVVDTSSGEARYSRTIEGRTLGSEVSTTPRNAGSQDSLFANEVDAKAVRGAVLEIIDYLECAMVTRDACLAEFDAKEASRRAGTRQTFRADGRQ
jgi:curli biogenesis system outer membrane secretion channel CsgG